MKTKEPVPLNKTADFGTGLTVKVSDIDSVKGVAKVPGEIAGPALKLTVVADNNSKAAIDLRSVVVFVTYSQKHTPAIKLSNGTRPLEGSLRRRMTRGKAPMSLMCRVTTEISFASR